MVKSADEIRRLERAALIAEVWYLDTEANGPITKILGPCGVRFRIDWPLTESIYWWEPTHPVFNEPNVVMPLLHYNRFWANQAGDKLAPRPEFDADCYQILCRPLLEGGVSVTELTAA
jgi:hypothetical protein